MDSLYLSVWGEARSLRGNPSFSGIILLCNFLNLLIYSWFKISTSTGNSSFHYYGITDIINNKQYRKIPVRSGEEPVLLAKPQEPETKLYMGGVQGNAESIFTGTSKNLYQYL